MNRTHIRLRGCPRCGGDLLQDEAYGEFEEACLQCGHRNYVTNQPKNRVQESIDWNVHEYTGIENQ